MKHILLVDDVSTNLKCAERLLRDKYKITMAKSGREALQHAEAKNPDLILLDIRMQDMDGYEVIKRLKGSPETADIPVIFLTADSEQGSKEKGLLLGAVDFIRKPFKPEHLLGRIERVWEAEEG